MTFSYSDLPDLSNKTFIITGSTAGLGRAQARILASHKAHVIIVGRSEPKIIEVVESIKKDTKNQNIEGMIADLYDLKSVAKFCDSFLSREAPIYSLTLNAATVPDTIQMTSDGIEIQWQTNVLSQYMMCMRLLPALKKSPEARVVVVSALGHAAIRSRFPMNLDYINNPASYGMLKRYAETKCANVLFTHYLSKKLKEDGHENIFVNTLHPGVVATEIFKNLWAPLRLIAAWFFTSPENGAKTQTYLAASPEVAKKGYRGQYFLPDAKLSEASNLSTDDEYAQDLVNFLESLLHDHQSDSKVSN